ncbi:mariner Mos1 transposase [Trichonephila clavipes]|nr:mariner Mos1 transposase [Trichonephila clavipes]
MTEWVPRGQSVKQQYYIEVLRKFRDRVRKKRKITWNNITGILQQDNASVYIALSVKQFLADKLIIVLKHPPHSPNLAPYDIYLFS